MPEVWIDIPEEPGPYLRSNPPISSLVQVDVIKLDGRLWYYSQDEGRRPIENAPDRWIWFGPIPLPFKEYNRHYDHDAG